MLTFAACGALALAQNQTPDISPIIRDAARVSGAAERGAWKATGKAKVNGISADFVLVFDDSCRYRMDILGAEPQSEGFDGKSTWILGPSGVAHRVIGSGRDFSKLHIYAMTGQWTQPAAGLLITARAGGADPALNLKPQDGMVSAGLTLDAKTHEPKTLEWWSDEGANTWRMTGYRKYSGRTMPSRVVDDNGSTQDSYDIQACTKLPGSQEVYAMPEPGPGSTQFDDSAPQDVEARHVAGWTFVHPLVDGQDIGWFFLDTGADVMCIEPSAAKQLGMVEIGQSTTAGVVGVSKTTICQGKSLKLGPLSFDKPTYIELAELTEIGKMLNMKVAGICGYDVMARATLTLDPKAKTLHISRPGGADAPAGTAWIPIGFDSNTPLATFQFASTSEPDKALTGVFALDTGSESTIDFCTPAVEKFNLESGQKLTTAQTGGAGGSATNKVGRIAWFDIGGQKVSQSVVGFQHVKQGAFASPYFTGNIGNGLLHRFVLVLDYRGERVGFAPVPPSQQ